MTCTRPQDGREAFIRGDFHRGGVSHRAAIIMREDRVIVIPILVMNIRARTSLVILARGTNVPWDLLDELRLPAYKKEDKPWDWILTKFPGRTETAVRQRVSIARNRGK